jgi:hypothetical protein
MRLGFDESQLLSWMKRPDEAAAAEAEKVQEVEEVQGETVLEVQEVEEVQGETVLEVPTLGTLLELLGHL